MRERRCSICDDVRRRFPRLVDPIADLVSGIVLMEANVEAHLRRDASTVRLYVGESLTAIDGRLLLFRQIRFGPLKT